MKNNKKMIFALLIIGLVLSSLIRITFNLSNGFEYREIWLKILPFPIIDFAAQSSNETNLTSTIVGYLIFLVAGFLMIKNPKNNIPWISIFIIITSIAIYFETTSIIQDLNNKFIGQHLRIGPFLFISGLLIFFKDKIKLGKNN